MVASSVRLCRGIIYDVGAMLYYITVQYYTIRFPLSLSNEQPAA